MNLGTRAFAAILSVTAFASVGNAQQEKYAQTAGGWYVYKEAKSCVMYLDAPSGTMIRISDRLDEDQIYFSVVNDDWTELEPREDETFSAHLGFPSIKRGHGTAAVIVKNDDGRMGLSMGNIDRTEFILHLAREGQLIMSGRLNDKNKDQEIEQFYLSDSYDAVLKLTECTRDNF